MTAIALPSAAMPLLLVVDIGSSSLRALLYDAQARQVAGAVARRIYSPQTTEDGGAELDPDSMFDAFATALDELLAGAQGVQVAGVSTSSLAASVLGVDTEGRPITSAYLYSDTRNAATVQELRQTVDWAPVYARTGCPLHTSYLPGRFCWLKQTRPDVFAAAVHWLSLHEYFLLKLFGRSIISHSLASWTGLLNRLTLDWDTELLALTGVRREQLSPLVSVREFLAGPGQAYKARWPSLAMARFYPAIGDGVAANLGSGCIDATRFAVTVGTSGAVRVVSPLAAAPAFPIPPGLWLYRVDERRALLGGSLNNGGNVFAYLHRTLQLSGDTERQVAALEPDAHGLTVLPFFAGERSPGYHGAARATVTGLNLETSPVEIWRAFLEGIAYRLGAIFELLRYGISAPREIVASGSALLNSPAWVQIIADVFGQAVVVSGEEEASARGAALLGLEALGAVRAIADLMPAFGRTVSPNAAHHHIYLRARERQQQLYALLIERS